MCISDSTVSFDSGATGTSNTTNYPATSVRAVDAAVWQPYMSNYGGANDQVGTPDRSAMRRIGIRVVTSGAIQVRINSVRLVDRTELTPSHTRPVVILESDDGQGSNVLMHRILSEYGIPGTINMIAENADQPDRLSTATLQQWQREGWDVHGHAYALTSQNYLGLTPEEVDEDMGKLKGWLMEHGFNGQFIAYPQGGYNRTIEATTRRYFRGARTVNITPMTGYGVRPYAIAAWSVNATDSISAITGYMDACAASGAPCHLVFHHFEDAGDINTTIDAKGWTLSLIHI